MDEEEIKKIKCIHLPDYKTSDKLCPAIEELKKEKEKNKEILEEWEAEQKHEMANTIPKSKIRKKIKELKSINFDTSDDRDYIIKILKELLEDE